MIDEILSSLGQAVTGDFIYSSLSFFGPRHGGELPGRWFVESIGSLGIEEQSIRQTLFRMERTGVLEARRVGRGKAYRASPATQVILDAGVSRVTEESATAWDGEWTLVHFRLGEEHRENRDRLRDLLQVEGYAALGPGMYIHPRDRTARLVATSRELGIADRINVFRGAHAFGMADARMVHELWDAASLANRYKKFIARYEAIAQRPSESWAPHEAFGVRFAFMFEFFRITWDDPGLPPELLPEDWPAERARGIADTLMTTLMPGALKYADQVFEGTATASARS